MYTWFISLVSIFIAGLLIFFKSSQRSGKNLPPGPSFFSSHLLALTNTIPDLQLTFRNLMSKYGPFFYFSVCSHPFFVVGCHSLAHKMLVEKGSVFSDRPQLFHFTNIAATSYGPTWRILRRNLASEFLQPSRVKSYSWAREWVLHNLILHLQEGNGINVVTDHFHYAVFNLFLVMCFGYKLDECHVNVIRTVQSQLVSFVNSRSFNLYMMVRWLVKMFSTGPWKRAELARYKQRQLFIELINSRTDQEEGEEEHIVAYVDTLMKLQIPDDTNAKGGKLTQKDLVSMCSEFLNAGTDTTSTTLEWIMANLVKHPHIQNKLYDEIVAVIGRPPPPPSPGKETEESVYIKEDDLKKMPYLKAVVLEGLRRHPPVHIVLPHRVKKEVELQGKIIPEGATITFLVREMGMDPIIWDDPVDFKPERFLVNDSRNGGFDISGTKGIKMMPFGAGRRMCPGSDLSLFQLEYFVSNLIWYFEWSACNGYRVDLSEKIEGTVRMKNPLHAQISARTKANTT